MFRFPTLLMAFALLSVAVHANKVCLLEDLSKACPDPSVDHDALVEQCTTLHGLAAAKCYMEYLCAHHDQDTVNDHKWCIDGQCPLAKRIQPLNCEDYLAEQEANADANAEAEAAAADAAASAAAGEEGGGAVPIPEDAANQDEHADETPEEHAAHATDDKLDQETQMTQAEYGASAPMEQETQGGMNGFTKFILFVFLVLAGVVGLMVFSKDKMVNFATGNSQASQGSNMAPGRDVV